MKSLIFLLLPLFIFNIKPQLLYAQEDEEQKELTLEQQIEGTKQLLVMINADVNGAQAVGAGIIIGREKDELMIVTAYHFLHQGEVPAKKISVEFRDKQKKYFDATILKHGDEQEMDWALLSVKNLSKEGFDICSIKFDRLGNVKNLSRGIEVYPLGNPNGMKWAIPVITDRITGIEGDNIVFQSNFIRIGNSGGALLDSNAQIIGMIIKDEPPFGTAINIASLLDKVPLHCQLYPDMGWTKYSLLHLAANIGDLEWIRYLLTDTCNGVNIRDAAGRTPLHLTAGATSMTLASRAKYSLDATKIFISAGADLNALDKYAMSPLGYAATRGFIEHAKILLKAGANLNGKGVKPLFNAIIQVQPEMVSFLIKEGADVNVKLENGVTPLHIAAENSTMEIIKMLIKSGAKINVKDNDGNTPLHHAILETHYVSDVSGFPDRLKALLDAGADMKLKNSEGKTPLECAKERWGRDYENIAEIFAKYNH